MAMFEDIDFANIPENMIAAKECRFAVYIRPPGPDYPDAHYIKEVIHTKDGRIIPNVRVEFDRTRPFWVTRKGFRNHDQHKEWERAERLQEFRSTERQLHTKVANALGMPWIRNLKAVKAIPYVYGIDVTSTAVIKSEYFRKYGKVTPFTVAELDIEADVIDGTECPTIVSLTMAPTYGAPARCYTFVTKQFADKAPNFIESVEESTKNILDTMIAKYRATAEEEIKFEPPVYDFEYKCEIVANDMEMWIKVFQLAHKWSPDVLSIWNMEYEMKKLEESAARWGMDLASLLSDPRLPADYHSYEYIMGKETKSTASKGPSPVKPAARWHHVDTPAPFIIVDQMCAYKQTRMGEQEESSYSLDAILKKELKLSKLHVPEADHIAHASLDWHRYMQRFHPVEYTVYNRFDTIGPLFIDEKVKDMSYVMPSMAANSDYRKFPSQPRRTCDNMHWYVMDLEEKRVMGVASSGSDEEYDAMTVDRAGWVVTLPAALITEQGLCVIRQMPELASRIYAAVGDLDVKASYPYGEVTHNTSLETTVRELVYDKSIPEDLWRMENMGVTGGHVNAYTWCQNILNFPSHEEVLLTFIKDTEIPPVYSFDQALVDMHGRETSALFSKPPGF